MSTHKPVEPLYRVSFLSDQKIYTLYAREVYESALMGFLEVGDFVFGAERTMVVDPSEERLRMEFEGVERTYVPVHAILRIDAVKENGVSKIVPAEGTNTPHGKVMPFPRETKS